VKFGTLIVIAAEARCVLYIVCKSIITNMGAKEILGYIRQM
jgi:hypothetical protein